MNYTAMHTALVTGGNRGIGLETCRQLTARGLRVILTGRNADAVARAVRKVAAEGGEVAGELLDVGDAASISGCLDRLERQGLNVDVLVNNAAIYPPGGMLDTAPEVMEEAFRVNFHGPWRLARALLPGMLRRGYGRVVNVTSGYGQFSGGLNGPAAYCLSKAALNALTVMLAGAARGNVKVNAACPGWVRTRMGGNAAPRSVEEGADTVVWLATLPANGPNGGLFRDRRPQPW